MYIDTVHCSYDLGTGFWNRNLHTKELSQTCGCYWINPSGELYEISYTGTQSYTNNDRVPYVPNGTHGKVSPVNISTTIRLQPVHWDAYYAKCPTCHVTLYNGKIVNHSIT